MRGEDEHGFGLPRFVEQEFRKFLACGVLARGFSRARCPTCGFEVFCAFSCQRRGLCPSCSTRRMHDTAAHLVDRVLPTGVAYRQWVLSMPRRIRFLLARDSALMGKVLRIFLRAVCAWQRRRARQQGISAPECAAVTAIQRFSGALSLSPHFHSILPDGVYTIGDDGATYHPLPAPTDDDVLEITLKIKKRVEKLVERRAAETDDVEDDPLALAQAVSVQAKFPARPDDVFDPNPRRRCAFVRGFSLHADTRVHENDRLGLERLCRYIARPALALERLSQLPDGRIRYGLKRPAKAGGPLEIVLTPLALMRRLATLVPPPKVNLFRYHGAFAPNYEFRSLIVPELPVEGDSGPGARCRQNDKTAAATDEAAAVGDAAAGDELTPGSGAGRGAVTGESTVGGRGGGPLVPGRPRTGLAADAPLGLGPAPGPGLRGRRPGLRAVRRTDARHRVPQRKRCDEEDPRPPRPPLRAAGTSACQVARSYNVGLCRLARRDVRRSPRLRQLRTIGAAPGDRRSGPACADRPAYLRGCVPAHGFALLCLVLGAFRRYRSHLGLGRAVTEPAL